MYRDNRNAEELGKALARLRELHPEKTAAERADLLNESYRVSMYAGVLVNDLHLNGRAGRA